MPKIAYTTDLHLKPGSPRVQDLVSKMTTAREKKAKAFFIGGDTFPLADNHWPILKEGIKSEAQRMEMEAYSKELVDSIAPKMISAARGLPIFILKGNADHIGYEHLRKAFPNDFIFMQNSDPISLHEMFTLGHGGIPAAPGTNEAVFAQNSPWYKGIMSEAEYSPLIINNAKPSFSWVKTVWMTHMPAFGHVDSYKGYPQGSRVILDLIWRNRPLIHLAGHVHDGAIHETEGEKEYRPHSVINNTTVSVNPGANIKSDEVNMVMINPELAYTFRFDGELEERAGECVSVVN
ncbi:metallophosphoesterase [Candidatus Margulisiibacteriota bacterium]